MMTDFLKDYESQTDIILDNKVRRMQSLQTQTHIFLMRQSEKELKGGETSVVSYLFISPKL